MWCSRAGTADDTRIVYGWVDDFEKNHTDTHLADLEDPDEPLKRQCPLTLLQALCHVSWVLHAGWLTQQVKLDRQRSKQARERALRKRKESGADPVSVPALFVLIDG